VAELVTDVPDVIWKAALLGEHRQPPIDGEERDSAAFARLVVDAAREELARPAARPDDQVDIWPCLGAALLEPDFLPGLAHVVASPDLAVLRQLSGLLAAPAATMCRSVGLADRGVA
jgi:hypothetical protein